MMRSFKTARSQFCSHCFNALVVVAGLVFVLTGPTGGTDRALAQTASSDLPSGLEVMKRVNERDRGGGARMRLSLLLHDHRGLSHERTVELARQPLTGGEATVYRITAPEHLDGIALLIDENRAESAMWMYFPNSDRRLRVKTRGLSALSSDFSCEDLRVTFRLEDYEFKTLEERPCGLRGEHTCIAVEMRPKTDRLRREFGYERAIGVVRKDISMIVEADYFAPSGERFKHFEAEQVEEIQGVWTARRYSMENFRAEHRSVVEVQAVEYRLDLPTDAFDPGTLGQTLPSP